MNRKQIATAITALALLAPASAEAHISLHPNTVPAGAFATIDVRMPGEQEGAHVTKLDVRFPPGFIGVDYENVPGWIARVIETKLAKPVDVVSRHEGHPGARTRRAFRTPGVLLKQPLHLCPADGHAVVFAFRPAVENGLLFVMVFLFD